MGLAAQAARNKEFSAMPIFEYICKECDHQFEALVYGKQKAECPKCHGSKLAPQLSVFAVSAKGNSGSASAGTPSSGACGSCGDPRGPGSCSRPNMN
jgi:putative FmdB family regulatory protein